MNAYITLTELASHYCASRPVMERRLINVGLCKATRQPSEMAVQLGLCRVQATWGSNVIVLWHAKKTKAVLEAAAGRAWSGANEPIRQTLRDAISTARRDMQWNEIVEIVIAMKAEEHGIHVRVI